jgi:hypothetical protein
VGISETLCPRVDALLGTVAEYSSARLARLTLDYLVDNPHFPLLEKIHEKFVVDLLALVYFVIQLEHPHNHQRYLDVTV